MHHLPFEHCTISLKHWLMHAESSVSQLVMHSKEISSHRSVHATFKSGTLNAFFKFSRKLSKWQDKVYVTSRFFIKSSSHSDYRKLRLATVKWLVPFGKYASDLRPWKKQKTYKHSVNGSKSSGRHQTKARNCIKSENLIFCNFWNVEWFYKDAIFDFPMDSLATSRIFWSKIHIFFEINIKRFSVFLRSFWW